MTTPSILPRATAVLVLSLSSAVLLAACGDDGVVDVPAGNPPTVAVPEPELNIVEERVRYALLDRSGDRPTEGPPRAPRPVAVRYDDSRLGLTTYGSSSCPERPESLTYEGRSRVVVKVTSGNGMCLADLVPTTFLLQLDPTRVDAGRPLAVRIERGRLRPVRLTAQEGGPSVEIVRSRPGEMPAPGDAAPSRPVFGRAVASREPGGRLLLTTYGSGSCPLTPVELRYVSRTEVEIGLHAQAGPCTDDLGPTTFVVQLDEQRIETGEKLTVVTRESGAGTAQTFVVSPPR